jgi:rod shape-determining protein MreD
MDLSPARLFFITLMLALGLLAIGLEAAPLGLAADAWPSPDILFCVVAYWSIRRPEAAVLPAVFALGLVRDLLTDVPAGAGLLTLVLASEFLKAVGPGLARRNFLTEWALLAMVLAIVFLIQWLVVVVLLAHPPYLYDLGLQWLSTLALYPVMAIVFRWLFRVGWRKPAAPQGAR